MTKIPIAPKDLQEAGKTWWQAVNEEFVLDPQQLELAHRAARQLDIIAAAAAIVANEGMVTQNRFGGSVAHPMIAVEANATGLFRHLCRQLRIAEEGK